MKAAKKSDARKTPGTVAVEKHRPLLNKLSSTERQRQRLRLRAAELLHGKDARALGRESAALEPALLEGVRSPHLPYTKAALDHIRKSARTEKSAVLFPATFPRQATRIP